MIKRICCLITFLLFFQISFTGQNKTDSLLNFINTNSSDTSRVKAYLQLADCFSDSIPDKSIKYVNQAYQLAKKLDDKKLISKAANQLGTTYYYLGDYENAIKNFLLSLNAEEFLKNPRGIASCLNNIGSVYSEEQNFKKALEYHQKALTIRIENVEKGIGDNNDVAMSYGNIGQAYYYLDDFTKAMEYYNRSLKISQDLGNNHRIALMLNNIGSIYAEQKLYDNALAYFTKSLAIQKQMENKQMVAMALNNIAELYYMKKDYKNSLDFYNKGIISSKEIGSLDDLKNSYDGLHNCHLQLNDFEKAHHYLSKYYEIKDSIFNTESSDRVNEMLVKFDTEKKEQEIQLLQKDQEIHKFWRNSLIVICLLIFLMVLLLYNRNKVKQKANNALSQINKDIERSKLEIQLKNNQLGEKNKEITDSIKYAKHLQLAILPPESQIKKIIPDSFILYKPKDIVSGDFYWVEEWGDQILVAAADCTGHGVPGAFMSIVCNNLLQQAVFNYGLSKPFLILNNLNKNMSNILHQSEETSAVKDGMDIALISIDKTTRKIEYAGAFNPLWIIRNGEIIVVAADKHPVGAFVGEELKQFTNKEFETQPGDVIYIFTDGYADQFGGEKGKKFKYKSLQQLLLNNQHFSMHDQKQILENTIEEWKGNLEQVDDILIIGIKV